MNFRQGIPERPSVAGLTLAVSVFLPPRHGSRPVSLTCPNLPIVQVITPGTNRALVLSFFYIP